MLSLVVCGYVLLNLHDLMVRTGLPTNPDLAIGVLSTILVVIGTWQIFGRTLPVVLFILGLYAAFGSHLPEPFTSPEITLHRYLTWVSTIGIDWGIWGDVVSISANYLFLFILFGAILYATGAFGLIAGI